MRELFSVASGQLTSTRVMAMIALVGGLFLHCLDLKAADCSKGYELFYTVLFDTALGGKAY